MSAVLTRSPSRQHDSSGVAKSERRERRGDPEAALCHVHLHENLGRACRWAARQRGRGWGGATAIRHGPQPELGRSCRERGLLWWPEPEVLSPNAPVMPMSLLLIGGTWP